MRKKKEENLKNDGEITRGALPKKEKEKEKEKNKTIKTTKKKEKTCGYSLSTYNKCPSVRR